MTSSDKTTTRCLFLPFQEFLATFSNVKNQQNRTYVNANSIGSQVNNRKGTEYVHYSNNFVRDMSVSRKCCTWTIIWIVEFIVTATNSFCQTKLKAIRRLEVTCCCVTNEQQYVLGVVHIFNILKNAEREKNTLQQQQQCLVVTFIYSFSLLILLYRHYFTIHGKHIRDFCGENIAEGIGIRKRKNLKFISGQWHVNQWKYAEMCNGNWNMCFVDDAGELLVLKISLINFHSRALIHGKIINLSFSWKFNLNHSKHP